MKSSDEFKEINPPSPEQAHLLMESGGRLALARLIASHIRRGLESGTWIVVNGRAIPVTMLHFYQEDNYEAESHGITTQAEAKPASRSQNRDVETPHPPMA